MLLPTTIKFGIVTQVESDMFLEVRHPIPKSRAHATTILEDQMLHGD